MDDRLTEAEFADGASLGAPVDIAASTWTVMVMQMHMFQLGVGGVEDMVE